MQKQQTKTKNSDLLIPSRSFDISALKNSAIDLHKEKASRRSKSISVRSDDSESVMLDVNAWLPAAAEHYNISADIRDYVLHPTIVNISGLPNTNGDSFSAKEWLAFKPKFGMLAYKTFKAKSCYLEHSNQDYRKSAGVIFDSSLTRLVGFDGDRAKLMLLLAFDRTLHPELCEAILDGTHNTYSMGVYYTSYTCSICGNTFSGSSRTFCSHTRINKPVYRMGDKLAYRICHNLEGFETSAVRDPAFICAASLPEHVLDPRSI